MATRKHVSTKTAPSISTPTYAGVHEGIVALVQGARYAAARSVNALMTSTYWEIGRRIVVAEQQGKRRTGYGDALTKRLAVDLTAQFGRGFGWRNLFQMRAFYLAWPDILQTASAISEASLPPATSLAAIASRFSPCPGQPTSACCRSGTSLRENSTKPRRCAADGAFANSIGRSAASSTKGWPCRATRPPC